MSTARSTRWFAVVGQAITADTPVGAGPFRSLSKALDAVEQLTYLGFNAYWLELQPVDEISWAPDWSDDSPERA